MILSSLNVIAFVYTCLSVSLCVGFEHNCHHNREKERKITRESKENEKDDKLLEIMSQKGFV